VPAGYLRLAKDEPDRFVVVDAAQEPAQVVRVAWTALEPLLGAH